MVPIIRYIVKKIIIILLYPLKLFPLDRNKVFLLNDINAKDANYSSNAKYLAEYMLKFHRDDFKIIYPLGNEAYEKKGDLPKEIRYVRLFTLSYYYQALTSKFFITTNGGISYLPFKKKQVVINTWHGGGAYKKMGLDVSDDRSLRRALELTERKTTYFVSSNRYFSRAVNSAFLIPEIKMLNFGMSRNDMFFDKERDNDQLLGTIKAKYRIPENHRIVLYAPTFRTIGENIYEKHTIGPYDIDYNMIKEALVRRFGGDWTFAVRLHPSIAKENLQLPKDIINMSDHVDIQEILLLADVLITDYSSTMWDFSFTYRPCFIFAPDIDRYGEFLGFYTSPYDWPFPLSTASEDLKKQIELFNEGEYRDALDHYYQWMENYEVGSASKQLVELMKGLKDD